MKINCYGIVCTGWEYLHPDATPDHLGYIPSFIDPTSDVPLREQIDGAYISGWNSFKGFTFNSETHTLKYPGDPAYLPIAKYVHKPTEETLYLYDSAWVCIVKGSSFEVARLD